MNTLSLPLSQQVAVWLASQAARPAMLDLAARLSLAGPLFVLDGGNHFNANQVARLIRRRTHHLVEALNHIHVRRAFTCYQMLAMLEEVSAIPASRRNLAPILVLDLLSTFYDENVPLREAQRLLRLAVAHLLRLAEGGPVVVSARPPALAVRERFALIETLQDHLPVYYEVETPALPVGGVQLPLWESASTSPASSM